MLSRESHLKLRYSVLRATLAHTTFSNLYSGDASDTRDKKFTPLRVLTPSSGAVTPRHHLACLPSDLKESWSGMWYSFGGCGSFEFNESWETLKHLPGWVAAREIMRFIRSTFGFIAKYRFDTRTVNLQDFWKFARSIRKDSQNNFSGSSSECKLAENKHSSFFDERLVQKVDLLDAIMPQLLNWKWNGNSILVEAAKCNEKVFPVFEIVKMFSSHSNPSTFSPNAPCYGHVRAIMEINDRSLQQ